MQEDYNNPDLEFNIQMERTSTASASQNNTHVGPATDEVAPDIGASKAAKN
jgi:hypothetical protein